MWQRCCCSIWLGNQRDTQASDTLVITFGLQGILAQLYVIEIEVFPWNPESELAVSPMTPLQPLFCDEEKQYFIRRSGGLHQVLYINLIARTLWLELQTILYPTAFASGSNSASRSGNLPISHQNQEIRRTILPTSVLSTRAAISLSGSSSLNFAFCSVLFRSLSSPYSSIRPDVGSFVKLKYHETSPWNEYISNPDPSTIRIAF